MTFLPKGRIVETLGSISDNSIVPIVSTDPPLSVQNMIRRVSDVQQMTLDAIWEKDDKALFEAFVSDPLVNIPFSKSHELFDRMLKACEIKY